MANTYTTSGTTVPVGSPPTANLCRVYVFFVDLSGAPLENVRLFIQNLYEPPFSNEFIAELSKEVLSDATGLAQVDLVQGSRVKVSISEAGYTRDIAVPAADSANLLTILGLTTDNFTVVRD